MEGTIGRYTPEQSPEELARARMDALVNEAFNAVGRISGWDPEVREMICTPMTDAFVRIGEICGGRFNAISIIRTIQDNQARSFFVLDGDPGNPVFEPDSVIPENFPITGRSVKTDIRKVAQRTLNMLQLNRDNYEEARKIQRAARKGTGKVMPGDSRRTHSYPSESLTNSK